MDHTSSHGLTVVQRSPVLVYLTPYGWTDQDASSPLCDGQGCPDPDQLEVNQLHVVGQFVGFHGSLDPDRLVKHFLRDFDPSKEVRNVKEVL